MTVRVQIPVYTDRWMRGDRYGEVVKTVRRKIKQSPGVAIVRDVAHVKLDISGKTIKVLLDDCRWVST